jgi:hypothetical protein
MLVLLRYVETVEVGKSQLLGSGCYKLTWVTVAKMHMCLIL